MIGPGVDGREARNADGMQGIVARVDETVIVGQGTVLADVTFRLDIA